MNDDEVGLHIEQGDEPGGAVRLVLSGELDLHSAPALRAAVVDVLARRRAVGRPSIVVELGGLTYADSAGLSMLVAAHKRATSQGGTLVLRSPTPPLRRVLEVSGLDTVLHVEGEREPGSGATGSG